MFNVTKESWYISIQKYVSGVNYLFDTLMNSNELIIRYKVHSVVLITFPMPMKGSMAEHVSSLQCLQANITTGICSAC